MRIGYALGSSILGGAFAPLIAEALLKDTGWSVSIGIYIMALCVISFIGVSLVKETKGVPLGADDTDAVEAERVPPPKQKAQQAACADLYSAAA